MASQRTDQPLTASILSQSRSRIHSAASVPSSPVRSALDGVTANSKLAPSGDDFEYLQDLAARRSPASKSTQQQPPSPRRKSAKSDVWNRLYEDSKAKVLFVPSTQC
jgi:hypothetical protein